MTDEHLRSTAADLDLTVGEAALGLVAFGLLIVAAWWLLKRGRS